MGSDEWLGYGVRNGRHISHTLSSVSSVSESALELQYNLLLVSMDIDRIFTADQIAVPPELPQIIKDYTKAVLRANPKDLLEFSRDYFQTQLAKADAKPGNFI